MQTKSKIKLSTIKTKRRWLNLEIGKPYPIFGKGKFVDVERRRGGFRVITSHRDSPRGPVGKLVLTPYQPNHGFLVEFIDKEGRSRWTNSLDYDDIYQKLGRNEERASVIQGGVRSVAG
jgi:hypothetical protein